MPRRDLTPEEAYVLDYAGDESGAFALLAWLGSDTRQPEKAATVVERLLDEGLVEIEEHREQRPDSRILSRDDALRAIRDPRKWRDFEREPFVEGELCYEARATRAGLAVLRQRGWKPS